MSRHVPASRAGRRLRRPADPCGPMPGDRSVRICRESETRPTALGQQPASGSAETTISKVFRLVQRASPGKPTELPRFGAFVAATGLSVAGSCPSPPVTAKTTASPSRRPRLGRFPSGKWRGRPGSGPAGPARRPG